MREHELLRKIEIYACPISETFVEEAGLTIWDLTAWYRWYPIKTVTLNPKL